VENEISEVTRLDIIDYIVANKVNWAGRLDEPDFLARLYDLRSMPSTDRRIKGAYNDIHQHRVDWNDWKDDWVFYDHRFNLLRGPDAEFLKFLAETVHPTVRSDEAEAEEMVNFFNTSLAPDGWKLVEVKRISERPIYAPHKIGQQTVFEEPTGWQKVDRQIQEMKVRLRAASNEEQYQAVGLLCREVLISVAQEVFDADKHPTPDGVPASETDAKRMLEAFFATELSGKVNEESRAHAKAALKLTLALQHKRTADFRMAALCAEATTSVVNLIAILSDRRN
jgi:hypothetical protein